MNCPEGEKKKIDWGHSSDNDFAHTSFFILLLKGLFFLFLFFKYLSLLISCGNEFKSTINVVGLP